MPSGQKYPFYHLSENSLSRSACLQREGHREHVKLSSGNINYQLISRVTVLCVFDEKIEFNVIQLRAREGKRIRS